MLALLLSSQDGAFSGLLATEVLLWLVGALLLVAIAAATGVWVGLARLARLERHAARLERLEDLFGAVQGLARERGDLDLRRIEHVLIDLRDAQKRLEDVLVHAIERTRASEVGPSSTALVPHAPSEDLGERVTNRLLAMGYERVHLVTRPEKLVELAARDGEVFVEARKDGALHKGRVLVRAGRLTDVELHPAYSIFP